MLLLSWLELSYHRSVKNWKNKITRQREQGCCLPLVCAQPVHSNTLMSCWELNIILPLADNLHKHSSLSVAGWGIQLGSPGRIAMSSLWNLFSKWGSVPSADQVKQDLRLYTCSVRQHIFPRKCFFLFILKINVFMINLDANDIFFLFKYALLVILKEITSWCQVEVK